MRVLTIDLLKIMSIFFVIVSHVTLFFLMRDGNDIFLYFFRQSGQLGVSLFFMCSGYFLLNNTHQDQATYIFHKIKSILIVLVFWICFYYLYDMYFIRRFSNNIYPVSFFNFFNVSQITSESTHLWFIFAIIPLYILIPLFHDSFTEKNKESILKVLIAITIISNFTIVNAITNKLFSFSLAPFNILIPFQSQGLLSFLIGGYLGMNKNLCAEYLKEKYILALLSVISFSVLSFISSRVGMEFFYGKFYNILLQISSVCFFLFVVCLKVNHLTPLTKNISSNIFGIYLVHNIFVVEIHSGFIHKFIFNIMGATNDYLYIIIYSMLSFILSYLLCVLLKKSKITSKIITI